MMRSGARRGGSSGFLEYPASILPSSDPSDYNHWTEAGWDHEQQQSLEQMDAALFVREVAQSIGLRADAPTNTTTTAAAGPAHPQRSTLNNTNASTSSSSSSSSPSANSILTRVCEKLEQNYIWTVAQLQPLDSTQWAKLGAPIGLTTAIQLRLAQRDGWMNATDDDDAEDGTTLSDDEESPTHPSPLPHTSASTFFPFRSGNVFASSTSATQQQRGRREWSCGRMGRSIDPRHHKNNPKSSTFELGFRTLSVFTQLWDWIMPADHQSIFKLATFHSLSEADLKAQCLRFAELWFIFLSLFLTSCIGVHAMIVEVEVDGDEHLAVALLIINILVYFVIIAAMLGIALFGVIFVVSGSIRASSFKRFYLIALPAIQYGEACLMGSWYIFILLLSMCIYVKNYAILQSTDLDIRAHRISSVMLVMAGLLLLPAFYCINLISRVAMHCGLMLQTNYQSFGKCTKTNHGGDDASSPPTARAYQWHTALSTVQKRVVDEESLLDELHRCTKPRRRVAMMPQQQDSDRTGLMRVTPSSQHRKKHNEASFWSSRAPQPAEQFQEMKRETKTKDTDVAVVDYLRVSTEDDDAILEEEFPPRRHVVVESHHVSGRSVSPLRVAMANRPRRILTRQHHSNPDLRRLPRMFAGFSRRSGLERPVVDHFPARRFVLPETVALSPPSATWDKDKGGGGGFTRREEWRFHAYEASPLFEDLDEDNGQLSIENDEGTEQPTHDRLVSRNKMSTGSSSRSSSRPDRAVAVLEENGWAYNGSKVIMKLCQSDSA